MSQGVSCTTALATYPRMAHCPCQINIFMLTSHKLDAYSTTHETLQWRKIGKRGRRRKGRGALNLCIMSFVGNSERQSFVRCTGEYITIVMILHKYTQRLYCMRLQTM
ncbi:hypothetical protein EVAR_79906_1 [Eumeta japonica]|uniref:Uncharacterized protein n=1 Tax=Eumeta variegata TaxID=151549 RepID=A0A4C1U0D1_EUMVA|nr:hypothetical protein EVAR_79906_1 [Eumeta japonica]